MIALKDRYIVITNNSIFKDREDTIYIEGDFIDVLKSVRDYMHKGYLAISHPLPASIRMILSPVRSVIMVDNYSDQELYNKTLEIVESSIISYTNTMSIRKPDYKNTEDYKITDKNLLYSSFDELHKEKKLVSQLLKEVEIWS